MNNFEMHLRLLSRPVGGAFDGFTKSSRQSRQDGSIIFFANKRQNGRYSVRYFRLNLFGKSHNVLTFKVCTFTNYEKSLSRVLQIFICPNSKF